MHSPFTVRDPSDLRKKRVSDALRKRRQPLAQARVGLKACLAADGLQRVSQPLVLDSRTSVETLGV